MIVFVCRRLSATLAWHGMGSITGLTSAASSKGYKVFAVISHLFTHHNQGLDLRVNLQQHFNKQTPLLTGRVLLEEFQPVKEQAEFVSMCS